jgi:hypothetical protein
MQQRAGLKITLPVSLILHIYIYIESRLDILHACLTKKELND